MMKVAQIGLGKWGKVINEELSKLAEVKYSGSREIDLNAIWQDPEVEAVFITTPTNTHYEIAKEALEAGKHVFLEKPGTDSAQKLEELVKIANEKGLKLVIGYEFPHHPAAKKLKELLSGEDIVSAHFDWQKWGSFRDDSVKHLFCHEVSLAKFWGLPLSPHLIEKVRVISDSDIVEIESQNIRFRINRVSPIKQKTITITTSSKTYIWSNDNLFEIDGQEMKPIEVTKNTPVRAEVNDFLNSDSPLCNGHFALDIYKTIEQI